MSFTDILIINLAVLAAVLISDLGLRAVTRSRLIRPVVTTAIIVPSFIHAVSTTGNDLLLQIGGVAAGVLAGLLAVSAMTVDHTGPGGTPRTRAGLGYASVWTVLAAARITFSYGAQHWFGAWLAREAVSLQVTATGITNALIFMAIAAVLTRTLVVAGRVMRNRVVSGGAPIPRGRVLAF